MPPRVQQEEMRLCTIAVELRVNTLHRGTSSIFVRMEPIEPDRCNLCRTLLIILCQLRKDCARRPYLLLRVRGDIPMPVKCCQQQTDHRDEQNRNDGIQEECTAHLVLKFPHALPP